MTMWGGRFEGERDPSFRALNDSLPVDWVLVREDIEGSVAWADALAAAGVLTAEECGRLATALGEIAELAAKDRKALAAAGDEDVHAWVEARLIERVGDLGRKLHTGRSRNDQVATDLRLWARRQVAERRRELHEVQEAILGLAERNRGAVLPGYTHLQPAQPVAVGHWCLAYVEMLQRDLDRLAGAARRIDQCPLGSGALAGTAWPIDRAALAVALGFSEPSPNSLDAVSDRDFAAELLFFAALAGVHLSRLAEDLIFYATREAGYVELDDSVTSGSSLMPQKKNPDALELLRGKSGRLLGNLTALLATLKGLPLAYNKDLQEDKRPLFDSMETLSACLRVLPPLLQGLRVDRKRALAAASAGYSNATDLADYLVDKGVPFRTAHECVGKIVRYAIDRGTELEALDLDELRRFAPQVEADVRERLGVAECLARRDVAGGTAPRRVAAALRHARLRLEESRAAAGETRGRIRQARLDDLDAICRLVDHWARQGENLPRGRQEILEAIADFGVAEVDGRVVGCGSLSIYTSFLAEIRSLGVDPGEQGGGFGSRLVRHFIDSAVELHIPKVFVLTRAPRFFERLGFHVEPMEALPEKVYKDCMRCHRRESCDEIPMVFETVA